MSKFEQLQATYKSATEVNQAYWRDLYQMVSQLQKDFCEYLGVSVETKIPVGQSGLPIVSIGAINDRNEYANWSRDTLPRDGKFIDFALKLTYGAALVSDVEPASVFRLKIMKSGDTYFVKLNGIDDAFKGPSFVMLFEELFRKAQSNINSR
ncbi:hypothetical protein [Pseudomonas koreensis]|uniref:hypothetical protein n=1 Tax=Pseudomonas koreensis TaxID=198620 RepID=UPI001B32E7F8|nr:hypothetical protein [Pseudomonas koreensis]MBP3996746.1 hypothetical protein [Pseudomonas koreensis]MBP3999941.1 hypothetical protein [Pseudomonas koreensis]MBP4000657.1 hypothetical protein [Pseudomonas koreensis]MBP4001536.1 hypothetical protein [Pseudomonas koreensis]